MKTLVILAAISLSLFSLAACRKIVGEGPYITETRSTGHFTGVSLETGGTVNFTIGPEYRVEITAQRNILDVLKTEISNGVLHIDFGSNVVVRNFEEMRIDITAPYADYFRLSGSGDLHVHDKIAANNLELKISGSGSINMKNVDIADRLEAKISGSGNIFVEAGAAVNEDLEITGSGEARFGGVEAENAVTRTSGSGDMEVSVSNRLDVKISGSGSVYYRGNPAINTHISGSGRVVPF